MWCVCRDVGGLWGCRVGGVVMQVGMQVWSGDASTYGDVGVGWGCKCR